MKKVPDTVLAGIGLGLVLAVVIAAAAIRLGIGAGWLRPVHRVAASLEVLVMLWLLWVAWRRPAVWVAAALTVTLSVAGIIGGRDPGPMLSAVNLLGGLALAATFAWILGALKNNRGQTPILLLLALQVSLGAAVSIYDASLLPLHGMLAVLLAALLLWLSRGLLVPALAIAAPLAGFTSLHYDSSALAALAHAIAAAALVAGASYAFARQPDRA